MATAATLPSGPPAANHRIFNILQGTVKISQELREILESAGEAFNAKSYKTAAKYFKNALDSWNAKDEKRPHQIVILIKYMLCMCWLESTDTKDLLDALRNLEELERNCGYEYPMVYYAVGKAYFKLYRFNKADEVLKKGFAVLNGDINVIEYNIPGTNIGIPESSRERLVAALVSLNDQCSSWHRPDAVCCMPDCSSHSHNEGADKNIFFGSPTFNGMVQVSCNNTSNFCIMSFHTACWKAKKEQLCSVGKMSDKDVLNWECFTPNCENQGVRCTIKKIEIFDENAEVKASIEPRTDDVVWHAKPNPQPKGAIRKQHQQQPSKIKVPSAEPRATPYERPTRPQPVPNDAPTHRPKIEENEEDDDIQDEQALKASIEKLIELRANNFDIKDDAIWRPDLQMYGNEYMLATAELIPDPDFTNEGVEEADLKAFFFSYFFTFISENGPVKLEDLAVKWNEAKNIAPNCDSVLKHYLDITEFLLQSVKFAVVGNHICVAGRLPEAYDLAKNDTCEILRFFMENDIDQRSNSSSIDDEAVFNDIINQEKNNNSLPYSSVSGDSKTITDESSVVSDTPADIDRKDDEKNISELKDTKDPEPSPPPTPEIPKIQSFREFDSKSQENGQITASEVVEASKIVEEKKHIVPTQFPATKDVKVESPTKRSGQKRPRTAEYPEVEFATETAEPSVKKEYEKQDKSSTKPVNGVRKTHEFEEIVFSPTKPNFEFEKLTKPIDTKFKLSLVAGKLTKESKSTNDLRASVASLTDNNNAFMSNSGEPANWPNEMKEGRLLSSPTRQNGVKSSEKTSDSPAIPKWRQEANLVAELVEEVHKLSAELAVYKEKTQNLESELEHAKKAHAAMRIRMLQKSLHGQYAYNDSTIKMKIEECRKNYEVCTGIQVLMNSVGQNSPNNGAEWLKVMSELEQISKNHQSKFWEINDQLYTTKDPEKLKEVDLQLETMPSMPQTKLIDIIQRVFQMYRMIQMVSIPPPPVASIRPPQSQPQTMFADPYRQSSYYTGPQLVQGNPGLPYHAPPQSTFMRPPMPQNVCIPSQRNSANSVPLNLPLNQNFPPPIQNFQNYPQQPNLALYQTVNSSVQQMQRISPAPVQHIQQISPAPVQQHVFTNASESTQQKASPIHQSASQIPQNAPTPIFSAPERPKLAPPILTSTPIPPSRSFFSSTQQNGQTSEQSVNLLPQRPNSVADIENRHSSEQAAAKISQGRPSFLATELPTISPAQERPATPVKRNSTFVAQEQNSDVLAAKNSQRAQSVPEIPLIFMAQERASTPVQKNSTAREKKENFEESKNSVEKKDKDQLFVVLQNSGTNQQQNWNSNILQAPMPFRDVPNANTHEDIDVRVAEDSLNFDTCAKAENLIKAAEKSNCEAGVSASLNAAPKETKMRKKQEHSLDKVMRKMREQYNGVLELDLLKGVECVRKKHNNSLSRLPISRIIREADKFIIDRQQKQLCGYGKRLPSQYFAMSNASPWCSSDGDRKRQSSASSTSSASSLKKEQQQSLSLKKKWEPVVNPNDTWERESPESTCAICLESVLNTPSYTLQCKHTYHKMCIKDWYQRDQSCPTCRMHSTIDDEYPPLPLG